MVSVEKPDPAFAVILDDTRTALRPPAAKTDLVRYRQTLDAALSAVRGPAVHSVDTVAVERDGKTLFLRVYGASPRPRHTVMFIHGGGFVIGSLDTHDALCRSLAVATGSRIVAVDYGLAPEQPFPGARRDCLAALAWAFATSDDGERVSICGDSAGGYLAVDVALQAEQPVSALGLLYPVVDPRCASESWRQFGAGHVLTRDWMRWAWTAYLGSTQGDASLLKADLARLPPTRIITAACDPLRDEGEALAAGIASAGRRATVTRAKGMIHGFASLPMLTRKSDEAVDDISRHVIVNMSVDDDVALR
ncbi:alpha/beta hydrolase [Sphingomonas profundi]|uniref:alpha/beta hydrolase n=1 Tax=Alterirhizorhabdus profundi TaxID=2681549 RepID=UPI0012E8A068|nr:alpha/beta hydrolase [Sphingomonas profundi]